MTRTEKAAEMAKMEINSRQINRYTSSGQHKVKTVRKIDPDKAELFNLLVTGAAASSEVVNIVDKNEAEFSFNFRGNSYTVKLIKHRPKKS